MSEVPAIQGVPIDLVHKVVLDVAKINAVELDLETIAEQCGLTVKQLRTVLSTPAFQAAQSDHEQQMMRFALMRTLKQMDKITNNPKAGDNARVAAGSVIVRTYAAMRQQKVAPDDPGEEFKQFMELLKGSQSQETNGSTRRTRSDQEA